MIDTEIKMYTFDNGEILRVQCVHLDGWEGLNFFSPEYSEDAFGQLCNVYRNFLVPAFPAAFPKMLLFSIPEGYRCDDIPYDAVPYDAVPYDAVPMKDDRYGQLGDKLTALAVFLSKNVKIKNNKPVFKNATAEKIYNDLTARKLTAIISGKRPDTQIIPVGNLCGFMSRSEAGAALKVNSSFFIMDPFDCGSLYDIVGTPFGLSVKDGVVLSPPLFGREALLVDKGGCSYVKQLDIYGVETEINGVKYIHGENCMMYERPLYKKTGSVVGNLVIQGKTDVVIVGTKVVAVKPANTSPTMVPSSGFVLRVSDDTDIKPGDIVKYNGFENISFGIQAGNSIIVDGVKTEGFISSFYNIKKFWTTEFPPSLYPLDYNNSRAARIAIGADADGRPCIIWAEGAGKVKYEAGSDSRGASLSDMCRICEDFGLKNAVSLDGGGSAQIIINGQRELHISDRNPEDNTDAERAVPAGLKF